MRNNPVQITRNDVTRIVPVETGESINLTELDKKLFGSLADVLEYPTEGWYARLEEFRNFCRLANRGDSEPLLDFVDMVRDSSLTELQEFYTRTFDLSPVCALEVGYHLFGEDYKRGAFLAQLRETENPYQLGQEQQLPDHLPVLLRLLVELDDPELRASLIGCCLLPALGKMGKQLRKKKNRYGNLIFFLEELLAQIAAESVYQHENAATVRFQNA